MELWWFIVIVVVVIKLIIIGCIVAIRSQRRGRCTVVRVVQPTPGTAPGAQTDQPVQSYPVSGAYPQAASYPPYPGYPEAPAGMEVGSHPPPYTTLGTHGAPSAPVVRTDDKAKLCSNQVSEPSVPV